MNLLSIINCKYLLKGKNNMVEDTRSEDTIIFNALTPGVSNMRILYDALNEFCSIKQENDPSDRFNIILFEQNGPNYLEDFTLNKENLIIALQSMEPILARANVAGGVMVAITFIIDVFKRISNKCFRLIILTDSGSLKIPEQFIPVLENLIDQVKDMPFIMDLVRIGIDDPKEDLKLMRLARRCHGDIHEINALRSLSDILSVLAIKKDLSLIEDFGDEKYEIPEDNQPFYENLADKVEELNKEETCAVCFQKDDKGLVRCPSCETIAHKKCWSMWAKTSNIGVPNLFRCHSCYNLISLDKDYVIAVLLGQEPVEKEIKIEERDMLKYLQSLESEDGPKILNVEDPMALSDDEIDEITFEFEDTSQDDDMIALDEDEIIMIWCDNCNAMITNEYKKCPKCGEPIN